MHSQAQFTCIKLRNCTYQCTMNFYVTRKVPVPCNFIQQCTWCTLFTALPTCTTLCTLNALCNLSALMSAAGVRSLYTVNSVTEVLFKGRLHCSWTYSAQFTWIYLRRKFIGEFSQVRLTFPGTTVLLKPFPCVPGLHYILWLRFTLHWVFLHHATGTSTYTIVRDMCGVVSRHLQMASSWLNQ